MFGNEFSPVVDLDHELADVDGGENLVDDLHALGVGDHRIVFAGNVKVALVELPIIIRKVLCSIFFCKIRILSNLSLPR